MDEGAGERQLLPQPTRKSFAAITPMRPKTKAFEQVFREPLGATRLNRPEAGDEFEIFIWVH